MIRKLSYFLPTLSESWLLVVVMLAGMWLGSLVPLPSDFAYVNALIGSLLPFFFVCLLSARSAGLPGAPSVKLSHGSFGPMGGVQIMTIASIALMAMVVCADVIPMPSPPKRFEELMERLIDEENLFRTFISVSVVAPLTEEFFCRGIILRGLLYHKSPACAIIWSSVIFAVLHMNPWQAVPAFLAGIFFGWIYYRTGSLWSTVFLHSLNNAVVVATTALLPESVSDMGIREAMGTAPYCVIITLSLIIFILTLLLLNKYMPEKRWK